MGGWAEIWAAQTPTYTAPTVTTSWLAPTPAPVVAPAVIAPAPTITPEETTAALTTLAEQMTTLTTLTEKLTTVTPAPAVIVEPAATMTEIMTLEDEKEKQKYILYGAGALLALGLGYLAFRPKAGR